MNCEELFEFRNTGRSWEITGLKPGAYARELEIPERYKGMPVRRIGDGAFFDRKELERLCLPPWVTSVGDRAFVGCENLASVEFSEGLLKIGASAFGECDGALKSVSFPDSLVSIGDYAFGSCRNLETVTFPNKNVKLGWNVLFDCPKLCAETQLISVLGSFDPAGPLPFYVLYRIERGMFDPLLRSDVFALALKSGCIDNADPDELAVLFNGLLKQDREKLVLSAAAHSEKLCGAFTELSVKNGRTELTARLLEIKRNTFGFINGGDNFEL
ncbi:MAG: leucine-rich repeat domain-containing protein [Ruminococcus sp.]|nr:leucine-rich repeat domain-containing protein [Ruminococcus sp.]